MPGSSDSVAATAISYGFPEGVAVDASGNLYISDFHMILKLLPSGNLDIIAGNGSWGYSGDGGMATAAELNSPTGLAFDASGNLFFAELGNNIIRRISPSGTITTVAGNGIAGFSGDRGHATAAKLNAPTAVAVDGSGNVYIADWLNEKVRKLTFSAMPTVTAIAGPASVALADTITLAATATPTGIWSSSHTGRALVSTGGAVTGIAVGSVTITFSATNTCGTVRTFKNISVYDPHVPLFPVGTPSLKAVCTGQFANIDPNLEVRDIDAGQTLTWSLLRAPRHGTANVTGSATATGGAVRPGGRTYTPAAGFTGRDTFTVRVTDGANTADLLMCMTVNASPAAPSISGPVQVCLNDSITLVGTPAGGMFNNTTGGVLCRPYGVVKGTAAGTSVITYTTPANALGCKATVTSAIAVKKLLSPVSITGATEVCTGSSITLNNDSTGGTWAVTNSTLATVSGGMVYGIAPGIDTVTYRYTNVCGTGIATRRITVNPSPDAGAITGPDTVLVGGFINLSRTTASAGVWSSSDNTIASVSAAGRVRGNSTGTDTIRYSVTNSCGTAIARKTITVIGFGGKAAGEATGTAIATTSIKVWPNPSEGTINLELPEAGATITVLDAAGRTVFAGTTTEAATAINLAELSAGTYILRVLCAGKVYAERVVIQ
jgi:sugar lactone lactonase YvrE